MCGITGWISYTKQLYEDKGIVENMTKTLSKRGPDDSRVWIHQNVAFGHRRLAVVDLEGGKQPMTKQLGEFSYTICYNGELYNTEDLRTELQKRGHHFTTHSDTEVLLTSYIEWKEECVQRLNGIFAFSVYDEERDIVFIARDRLGVKPFFYYENDEMLLFGSEIKAILEHPNVMAKVGREQLCEIWGLGPSRSPGSGVFYGIKELRPAHAMVVTKNGAKVWRYWNVVSAKHEHNLEETVEQVRYLVQDSIVRQLVSDVPLSTFLSGGLDSSAITAIAAIQYEKEGKVPLHTYSIEYEDNDKYFTSNEFQPNSDVPYINMMRENFQTEHHQCIITTDELIENLQEAVFVRDQPGMADVDSSLLWFCREIRKGFVVSLSGECADEIFGGYPWFHRKADLESKTFPWMRSLEQRENLLKTEWREKLQLEDYIQNQYNKTLQEMPRLEGESEVEERRRELFYLNMLWFMTTLLDRKDRMSMAAGLEVRVPFADHRIVEYLWNVPWEMKMLHGREKGLLRKALEGILPEDVLYRKKSPYPKTHNPQYTKAVKGWLASLLDNKDSALYEFLNKEELTTLLKTEGASFTTPWYGQLMTGPQLLAHLAQIHVWFEKYRIDIKS